jgi:hypothetical protein
MREDFLNQRSDKIRAAEELTKKKSLKRQKKKDRQKQLKKKAKLLRQLQGDDSEHGDGTDRDDEIAQKIGPQAGEAMEEDSGSEGEEEKSQ